jgi:putative membrane protein insertion efficiency factor
MNSLPYRKLPVALSPEQPLQWFSLVVLAIIEAYRAVLSPVLLSMWGPGCRFEPTCSAYAAGAIARYGLVSGGWMAVKRLLKCQPLGGWGFDPIPSTRSANGNNIGGHRGSSR